LVDIRPECGSPHEYPWTGPDPEDDVGAHNKLRRLFDIDTELDYETVHQLVARWHPYEGMVYFHLLPQSLSEDGLLA
jgi:DNA-3-methyladenine glycosylase II